MVAKRLYEKARIYLLCYFKIVIALTESRVIKGVIFMDGNNLNSLTCECTSNFNEQKCYLIFYTLINHFKDLN